MNKQKKVKIIVLSSIAGIFLLLIIAALIILSNIFSDTFEKKPKISMTMKDYFFIAATTQKIYKSMSGEELADKEEIVCSEQQFNTLLYYAVKTCAAQLEIRKKYPAETLENTSITLNKGIFTAKAPYVSKDFTLFGKYVNITVNFRLNYKNGSWNAEAISGKLGNVSIPVKTIQKKTAEKLDENFNDILLNFVAQFLTEFKADGKNVIFVYSPKKAVYAIDKYFFKGDGSFVNAMKERGKKK